MTSEEYLNELANQQRISTMEALKQQYNTSKQSLDTQEAAIDTNYLKDATAVDVQTQQAAKRLREIMANKGYATGQQYSGGASLLASGQQALSDLGLERRQSYNDIASQRTALDQSYASQTAQAEADVQSQLMENLYNERQTTISLATQLFSAGLMSASKYSALTGFSVNSPSSGSGSYTYDPSLYSSFYDEGTPSTAGALAGATASKGILSKYGITPTSTAGDYARNYALDKEVMGF